ncbi:hypothetical protein DUI87_27167 [Hirundo rustica rustica]|uniref:ribonuclease H n=1 Tax=Hirundo rustica rustica TaxID=333673 RepID=A0A3M0JND2_HIRRU|nr:hypothetical protein DUI87_27167 [Hirundo rustica rustica]
MRDIIQLLLLEQFWGLVHGIWPRLKKDRRRDGRSLFGPPGQLVKREQPGTSNEEERRRRLTSAARVGVIPKDGKMVVHIMKLTQGDIQEINPEVWATEGKDGCLDIPPIKIEMQKDTPAIRVKQYPMSPEGKKGLASVIEHLLKENILEPCMSPHNTPILAIKKDEGKFRLVQDLREINKRTIARHPVVPNPYTLLSKIPREHTWFTVIDLKDAFWACPLAEECRDWFAFEWEQPDRGRKQQLRWMRLPQGYTESPNIFGQALETLLEQFSPKEGVQILQYVDDLLISGETEKEVKNVSIQLLNFFGEKGLKVSQSKLQFVETEVTYLGHIIGKGSKRLSPARISGIVSISPPKTKRDIRKLLGLFGYCKHWIDKYTQGVKFLYDKLIDQEPMNWTESDEKQLQDLKEKLSSAPVLSLPDLKKEFDFSKDYLEGEEVTRKYLKTIGQTLENLRKKGYLPQTSPLDANVHNINPGDWVLIKTWTNIPLTPKFKSPYEVLLTTHTAVCTKEKGWTPITRVKGPVPPPGENLSSAPSPDETEWTVTPHPKDLKLTFKKK